MKSKKIIVYIMSITLTCSSIYCLSNLNGSKINTVSAFSISKDVIECTGMECTIKNPDFVISEDEELTNTDLERHGIKITRNVSINDPSAATTLSTDIYRAEHTQLYECGIEFPQNLAEGKNTIHIHSISPFDDTDHLECDLDVNITFSENSEKKDLCKRSEAMFGDVDSSNEVDIKDLVDLSMYLLGDETSLTAGQYMCADVTGDDEVDICDLAMLKQYLMKDEVDLGLTKKPDEDISFIKIYRNGSCTFQCTGVIYDKEGNEYNFDFSDGYPDYTDNIPFDRIKKAYRTSKCNDTHKLNAEDMEYMNSLINKLDENPEFNEPESVAWDYGQKEFYAVKYNEDNTVKLIKVYSYGDLRYTPKDENAAELFRYYCKAAGISNGELLIYDTEDD